MPAVLYVAALVHLYVVSAALVTIVKPTLDYHCEDPLKIRYTTDPSFRIPEHGAAELSINSKSAGQYAPDQDLLISDLPYNEYTLAVQLLDKAGAHVPNGRAEKKFISRVITKFAEGEQTNELAWFRAAGEYEYCRMDRKAIKAYKTILRLNRTMTDAAWQLGEVLTRMARHEDANRFYRTILTYAPLNRKLLSNGMGPPARPSHLPTLMLLCMTSHDQWGPSSVDGPGIGGSEEAAIFISREFAKLGYFVEVYGLPAAHDQGLDKVVPNVWWLPWGMFNPDRPAHVHITWRNLWSHAYGARTPAKYIWLHDSLKDVVVTPYLTERTDAYFVLSKKEHSRLPAHAAPKGVVTANGLNPAYFRDGPNRPTKMLYASSPDRGLWQLLNVWPIIKQRAPDATLDVYYGFNKLFIRRHGEETVNSFMQKLSQPGITYHGMVNQSTLANAFADCAFWLYPTSFEETSCITAMKAQAMGAIPITSRHPDSALNETCGRFDLGPPVRGARIDKDQAWLEEWAQSVVAAVHDANSDRIARHRQEMKAWARSTFSWAKIAKQWSDIFEADLRAKQFPITLRPL